MTFKQFLMEDTTNTYKVFIVPGSSNTKTNNSLREITIDSQLNQYRCLLETYVTSNMSYINDFCDKKLTLQNIHGYVNYLLELSSTPKDTYKMWFYDSHSTLMYVCVKDTSPVYNIITPELIRNREYINAIDVYPFEEFENFTNKIALKQQLNGRSDLIFDTGFVDELT